MDLERLALKVASLPPWDSLEQTVRYSNSAVSLIGKLSRSRKTGLEKEFTVLKYPDWVHVAALTESGDLVLVRQFRHGVDGFTIELPGGAVDAGETPEQAAARELLEETNFSSEQWESLGSMDANPAINTNRVHAALALGAVRTGGGVPDLGEEIEVLSLPVREVVRMCLDGRITHPFTHSTVFRLVGRHPDVIGMGP